MNLNIPIIYEDHRILIIHKPAKMLAHPDHKQQLKDVLTLLDNPNLRVVTRLDANTEGLMILAKTPEAHAAIQKLSDSGQMKKKYLARCVGYFEIPEAIVEAYLIKDDEKGRVLLSKEMLPGAKRILTKYKVLDESNQTSLVEIVLLTGRTHQIRAHMALLGHPVLGDPLYGNPKTNQRHHAKVQQLCSWQITFEEIESTHLFADFSHTSFTTTFCPEQPPL
ncbi:MAG: RluA family pseudouridine synthase [Candidatus Izemoplasmatales bacterium]